MRSIGRDPSPSCLVSKLHRNKKDSEVDKASTFANCYVDGDGILGYGWRRWRRINMDI